MSRCSEISLILGPFDDGELEPHEMQEVARHLAVCASCERLLNDFTAIGRELRTAVDLPPLNDFAEAVDARIRKLRPPIRIRVTRLFEGIGGWMGTPAALASLTVVAAALTLFFATPYTRHYLMHEAPAATLARANTVQQAAQPAGVRKQLVSATNPVPTAHDSYAVISRLEAEMPSVAVWSEPQDNTTVIWLPEDNH